MKKAAGVLGMPAAPGEIPSSSQQVKLQGLSPLVAGHSCAAPLHGPDIASAKERKEGERERGIGLACLSEKLEIKTNWILLLNNFLVGCCALICGDFFLLFFSLYSLLYFLYH